MTYTITTNEDGYTNLNAADYMIQFFEFMQKGSVGWNLFTLLHGGHFDYMKFTPDDYVWEKLNDYNDSSCWAVNLGNGWTAKVQISHTRSYRSGTAPGQSTLMVSFRYQNNWCYRPTVEFTNGKLNAVQWADMTKIAESYWKSIFDAIKRRAAITIREHRNYLANPAFYDTLERELNIKVRKKK